MPSYKLHYFNVTGIGEPIRFLLSYVNANFEDRRIEIEDWQKHQAGNLKIFPFILIYYKNCKEFIFTVLEMPFGVMPVLEIDGKKYSQSKSICRYLAKKFNLYGSNDLEALEIDASADAVEDVRMCKFIYKIINI